MIRSRNGKLLGVTTDTITGRDIGTEESLSAEGIGCGKDVPEYGFEPKGSGGGSNLTRYRTHECSTSYRHPDYYRYGIETPEGDGSPYYTIKGLSGQELYVSCLDPAVYKPGVLAWLKDKLGRIKFFIRRVTCGR